MTRKDGETVDDYLARRKKNIEEANERERAERKVREEEGTAGNIAELKKQWPGREVTIEGRCVCVHLKCSICGKKYTETTSYSYKHKTEVCEKCRRLQFFKNEFPNNRVSKDKGVEFTCSQCNHLYWYIFDWIWRDKRTVQIPKYCSDYCKWVSGLKRSPIWNREEWEKIEAVKKAESSDWASEDSWFFGEGKVSSKDYELGDPQQDANQEMLFASLKEYFDEFEEPNRRLNVIHNIIRKLRSVANDCHVEICS